MENVTDTPRKVASEEELVDALMFTRGLTRDQAEHQARSAWAAATGEWTADLVGAEPTVDPNLIFTKN